MIQLIIKLLHLQLVNLKNITTKAGHSLIDQHWGFPTKRDWRSAADEAIPSPPPLIPLSPGEPQLPGI